MSKDVFAVIINDPSGIQILDSIHHHANGRGVTYGKVGALARVREIEKNGQRGRIIRLKTGIRFDELWELKKWYEEEN